MRALGMVAVLAVVGLALVAGTVVLAYLAGRRRRAELAAVAARRGWEFAERDDTWVAAFAGAPFGLGHRRRAVNVLRGTHGDRRFVAFDYCYDTTEASTDAEGRVSSREVTHWFTIVAVDADAVFPALEVTPESFFGRMMGRLTGDIQFESEAFNRAFTVRCPDREFAFD
ncbi:MAG TPA: hypothetical protein PKB06_04595, partial [Actinotalea sp.]|nr:hypothetical protein [Actinotalea sp.]